MLFFYRKFQMHHLAFSVYRTHSLLSCDRHNAQQFASVRGSGYVSVKLHLRDGRTDEETRRPSVRSFVRLSLCPLCLSRASILWGNKPQCFN